MATPTHAVIQGAGREYSKDEIHEEPREVGAPEEYKVGDKYEVGLSRHLDFLICQSNIQIASCNEHLQVSIVKVAKCHYHDQECDRVRHGDQPGAISSSPAIECHNEHQEPES